MLKENQMKEEFDVQCIGLLQTSLHGWPRLFIILRGIKEILNLPGNNFLSLKYLSFRIIFEDFETFPFIKRPFRTGQNNRHNSVGPWGDNLMEVRFTVVEGSDFRDFDKWQLNRGWPSNTGLSVYAFKKTYFLSLGLLREVIFKVKGSKEYFNYSSTLTIF